ncbi:MAG: hypothetical protein ACI9YR_000764 [Bacteroidia bacterium]|jgi:hypothetical protein
MIQLTVERTALVLPNAIFQQRHIPKCQGRQATQQTAKK